MVCKFLNDIIFKAIYLPKCEANYLPSRKNGKQEIQKIFASTINYFFIKYGQNLNSKNKYVKKIGKF